MDAKEVKNLCFDLLKEKLTPLGYKGNKKEQEFIKMNDIGFDKVYFGIVAYPGLGRCDVDFFISVRIEKIQMLVNRAFKFTNENRKYINPTCNINIGTFVGNPKLDFETFSPEDVKNAVETFWQIFQDFGIEHIKKCYDINFLNSIYPTYKRDSWDWFTASNWYFAILTVAYLADKKTFPAFRKEFTDYLVNDLNMPENKLNEMNEYLDNLSNSE